MKKHLLVVGIVFLFLCMGFQPAFANDVSIDKQEQQLRGETFYRRFGGLWRDYGDHVQQTSDGGYIIIGSDDCYLTIHTCVLLIKTDSSGNIEWKKTFGDFFLTRAWGECVQQTSDGGYILTGKITIYDDSKPISNDVWLIKTDSNGNMEWNKKFGGQKDDAGFYVQQTTDGGYIITGHTLSYGAGKEDVWLIKTDNTGKMEWDKTFGGANSDWCRCGQQTTDGGYILSAETYSFGGTEEVWLIKTDSNGTMIWDRVFKGTTNGGDCVQQTTDGGYITTGSKDGVWLIKTDSGGNTEWEKSFRRSLLFDFGCFVQQTSDGGYILLSATWRFGDVGPNIWLIKTDNDGNKIWDSFLGALSFLAGSCVQQTTDGGYIITGVVFSLIFHSDMLLIKTNKNGMLTTNEVTNPVLLRNFERFPLLYRLLDVWRSYVV